MWFCVLNSCGANPGRSHATKLVLNLLLIACNLFRMPTRSVWATQRDRSMLVNALEQIGVLAFWASLLLNIARDRKLALWIV